MELLVTCGADLGLRNKATLTPLQMLLNMVVCRSGEQPVVEWALPAIKLLVEAGSDLQPWAYTTEGVLRWVTWPCLPVTHVVNRDCVVCPCYARGEQGLRCLPLLHTW